MELLGYGEDALTYWAITQRLDALLQPFGDSAAATGTVFFRPSFGRRSSSWNEDPSRRGAQFGEFDSIISTEAAVYLIEAKWSSSGEVEPDRIVLRAEQIRRHRVFGRYLTLWGEQSPATWEEFHSRNPALEIQGLAGRSESCETAPVGSRLARNLTTVLTCCARVGKPVRDVILVVHPGAQPELKPRSGPEGFQVVEIDCPAMRDGFILLGDT
ncbi:MAG: hypothetical protein H0W30_01035 [Gemmatimonadaceae bacterium]|nr:hypothetical protein [Gemmatimonadaceae bacterium]